MAELASWQRPATLDDSENAMDDSENAFVAAPAWETCKENSMPRKSGRKAAAFGTERPAEVADEREQRRAQWELELSDTSDPNPLNTWWSCIKWTQEEYPKGGKDAQLLSLVERCAHTFKDDGRYADDIFYLRVWIMYADLIRDAEQIFDYLYDRHIGQTHALFWLSWSAVLEAKRKFDAADKAYTRGIAIRAEPTNRLKKAHESFMHRLMKNSMQPKPAEEERGAPVSKERKALNRMTRKEAAPGAKRPMGQQRATGTLPVEPAKSGGGGGGGGLGNFQVFVDPESSGGAADENGEARVQWETGTSTQNAKENSAEATAWAGVTLPQQKRSRGAGAGGAPGGAPAPVGFTLHVDEEFAAEPDEPDEAPPPPEQTARSLRLQLDGPQATTSDASARLFEKPLERFGSPPPAAPPPAPPPAPAPAPAPPALAAAPAAAAPAAAAPAPAAAGKRPEVAQYDASLLEHKGEECSFEEARARQRHAAIKAGPPKEVRQFGRRRSGELQPEAQPEVESEVQPGQPAPFQVFEDAPEPPTAAAPPAAGTFSIFEDAPDAPPAAPPPASAPTSAPPPAAAPLTPRVVSEAPPAARARPQLAKQPSSYATQGSNPRLADPRQICCSHVCASFWTGIRATRT